MSVNTNTLSPAKRWLMQRMHQTNYGTMHDLIVRDGEPVIDPPPRIKRAFKLGGKRSTPKQVPLDFVLKQEHLALFELMEEQQNGVISKLVIQDGLPFVAEWEVV